MSIWCSWPAVGYSDFADPADDSPRCGQVLSYAAGFSNHYPTLDQSEEMPAAVDVSHIAPWCVSGHDQNGKDWTCSGCNEDHEYGDSVGDWLRLGIRGQADRNGDPVAACVVMDEAAVTALVTDLTAWLARPKVKPPGSLGAEGAQEAHNRDLTAQEVEKVPVPTSDGDQEPYYLLPEWVRNKIRADLERPSAIGRLLDDLDARMHAPEDDQLGTTDSGEAARGTE